MLAEFSTAMGREKRLFHAILHEVDLTKIRSKATAFTSPPTNCRHIPLSLAQGLPIVNGEWWRLQIASNCLGRMGRSSSPAWRAPAVKISRAPLESLNKSEREV